MLLAARAFNADIWHAVRGDTLLGQRLQTWQPGKEDATVLPFSITLPSWVTHYLL